MTLHINQKLCKGCGICIAFCPKKILLLDERSKIYAAEPEQCIQCGQCELRCPDFAIKVVKTGGIRNE